MIVFLTLCYVGLLALLIKIGLIKFTLWWKLSPLIWMLLLLVVLFIPMQWGAPSGSINVYAYVVEIIPNVSGEVIEVPARGLERLQKGDTLFRIDPAPFETEVERLEAVLAAAEQSVPQLKAAVDEANAGVDGAKAKLVKAKLEFDRQQALIKNDATAQRTLDTASSQLTVAESTLREMQAKLEQKRLIYQSNINGMNTSVAQARAALKAAKINLAWTDVKAPSDGFAVANALRPGQRVTSMAVRGWMSYVVTDDMRLAVAIDQFALRHIKPGQAAEVTLKLYPGKTFQAKVEEIVYVNNEAQIRPSGEIPKSPSFGTSPYMVLLTLENHDLTTTDLPGGSIGTAAIYTDVAKPTQLIRKIMIRMQAWMNYVFP
ncbi:MAG: HlyD family secretion protein [Planctomycetaceae bacterium]|nr:HlyD family secretion protein [Planctomycetaceae bacterium]